MKVTIFLKMKKAAAWNGTFYSDSDLSGMDLSAKGGQTPAEIKNPAVCREMFAIKIRF